MASSGPEPDLGDASPLGRVTPGAPGPPPLLVATPRAPTGGAASWCCEWGGEGGREVRLGPCPHAATPTTPTSARSFSQGPGTGHGRARGIGGT